MNKELTPLEALHELGVFNAYELKVRLSEEIQNLYIKLQGNRLTKIKNLLLPYNYGEEYKVVGNVVYYQKTYDLTLEEDIPMESRNWCIYGIIEWIGKKEDYKPKQKVLSVLEYDAMQEKLKALEIIKKYGFGVVLYTDIQPYNAMKKFFENNGFHKYPTQEEYDLLKEVLL